MSFLRKASTGALRNFRPKSASSEGSYFGEGARTDKNGLLFGETPPPPGQKRKWESWEAPWYVKHSERWIMSGLYLLSGLVAAHAATVHIAEQHAGSMLK